MWLNWKYYLTFALMLFSKGLLAGELVVEQAKVKLIGESLHYFDDRDNQSYQSILNKIDQFEKWDDPVFSGPAQPGKLWFYFSLKNESDEDLWMDINNSNLTYIDFYKFNETHELIDSAFMGCMIPVDDAQQTAYTFQHKLADRSDKEFNHFLIGIRTYLNYEIPIFVGPLKQVSDNRVTFDNVSVFVIGAFLILFFYNVFIFFVTRDKIYLHYSMYLLAALTVGSYLNNFPFIESLIGKSWAYTYLDTWLWTVFGATGLFTISYFDLKKTDPVFYKTIVVFIVVFIGFGIANLFVPLYYLANIYQLLAILFYVTCLVFSYRLLFRGVKRARLYCVGWSFMMVGAILYIFVYNGYIPYNAFTRNLSYLGSLIEVLIFSIALARRISDLKLEQTKLNQSLSEKNMELTNLNDSLDSFNYHVSHDLKTVLNNTLALSRMAEKYNNKNDNDRLSDIISKLQGVAKNGAETVHSFLSLGRIDSLLKDKEIGFIQLDGAIKELIETHNLQDEIEVVITENTIGDFQMHQKIFESIFLNFLTNTIKYNHNKPKARIQFIRTPEHDAFNYSDNGIGIDLEKYGEDLFKPFQRGAGNEKQEGTGVGLYLVKRIVDNFGGSITVESELGQGANFQIIFPRV